MGDGEEEGDMVVRQEGASPVVFVGWQDQHNTQHMQFTRRREEACQDPKTARSAFRKRSVGR